MQCIAGCNILADVKTMLGPGKSCKQFLINSRTTNVPTRTIICIEISCCDHSIMAKRAAGWLKGVIGLVQVCTLLGYGKQILLMRCSLQYAAVEAVSQTQMPFTKLDNLQGLWPCRKMER